MSVSFDKFSNNFKISLKNKATHSVEIGTDIYGNILRIDNLINNISSKIDIAKSNLEKTKNQLEVAKKKLKDPLNIKKLLLKKKNCLLN